VSESYATAPRRTGKGGHAPPGAPRGQKRCHGSVGLTWRGTLKPRHAHSRGSGAIQAALGARSPGLVMREIGVTHRVGTGSRGKGGSAFGALGRAL